MLISLWYQKVNVRYQKLNLFHQKWHSDTKSYILISNLTCAISTMTFWYQKCHFWYQGGHSDIKSCIMISKLTFLTSNITIWYHTWHSDIKNYISDIKNGIRISKIAFWYQKRHFRYPVWHYDIKGVLLMSKVDTTDIKGDIVIWGVSFDIKSDMSECHLRCQKRHFWYQNVICDIILLRCNILSYNLILNLKATFWYHKLYSWYQRWHSDIKSDTMRSKLTFLLSKVTFWY
jgi:hypothetical protein